MTHPAGEWSPEQYRPYLYLLASTQLNGRLRTKADASDIVQGALLRAWQSLAQFRGQSEGEFKAWLRQVLAHHLAEVARRYETGRRDAGRERSLEAALDESSLRLERWLAADQSSPSTRLAQVEQFTRLADALAQLPDDQRRAVELHHLQGLPVADAAQAMGRSGSSVSMLLYRGLKRLRELLEEGRVPKE